MLIFYRYCYSQKTVNSVGPTYFNCDTSELALFLSLFCVIISITPHVFDIYSIAKKSLKVLYMLTFLALCDEKFRVTLDFVYSLRGLTSSFSLHGNNTFHLIILCKCKIIYISPISSITICPQPNFNFPIGYNDRIENLS